MKYSHFIEESSNKNPQARQQLENWLDAVKIHVLRAFDNGQALELKMDSKEEKLSDPMVCEDSIVVDAFFTGEAVVSIHIDRCPSAKEKAMAEYSKRPKMNK